MSTFREPNKPDTNRRNFFRLNLHQINVLITVLGDPDEDIPSETYNAMIHDLSGGGISFYTHEPLIYTEDDIVTVTFDVLNEIFHEQVSFVRNHKENSHDYFYACQFNNMDRQEQDKLASIVLRLQSSRK